MTTTEATMTHINPQEIEYTAPNGDRYLISSVSEPYNMPFPGGAEGSARTVTGRRWIKSRQAFAKHPQEFMTRGWGQWVRVGEDHSSHGHANGYDEATCDALGRRLLV